jgi:hypothetical protein
VYPILPAGGAPNPINACSIISVGLDGGIEDGNRILGNISDIENRSMYCANVQGKKIWLPQLFLTLAN